MADRKRGRIEGEGTFLDQASERTKNRYNQVSPEVQSIIVTNWLEAKGYGEKIDASLDEMTPAEGGRRGRQRGGGLRQALKQLVIRALTTVAGAAELTKAGVTVKVEATTDAIKKDGEDALIAAAGTVASFTAKVALVLSPGVFWALLEGVKAAAQVAGGIGGGWGAIGPAWLGVLKAGAGAAQAGVGLGLSPVGVAATTIFLFSDPAVRSAVSVALRTGDTAAVVGQKVKDIVISQLKELARPGNRARAAAAADVLAKHIASLRRDAANKAEAAAVRDGIPAIEAGAAAVVGAEGQAEAAVAAAEAADAPAPGGEGGVGAAPDADHGQMANGGRRRSTSRRHRRASGPRRTRRSSSGRRRGYSRRRRE